MASLTWWISSWQVILLNFSLLVPIKNYFDRFLTIDRCIWSSWYHLQSWKIYIYIYFISGLFYCNSHTKMYFRTYGVFINNSVLSFHFVFQRSCCSIQTIKKTLLKICSFFVSQKIPSADGLNPGQPLPQVGFWSLWDLMCALTQERLLSRAWCLPQHTEVWWPGGKNQV